MTKYRLLDKVLNKHSYAIALILFTTFYMITNVYNIPFTKGVCGAAYTSAKTLIVDDVHKFPGQIACDSASNSEIVIPVKSEDKIIEGRVDDEYETEPTDDVPAKFEFTADMPQNSEGIMTEDEIVVTYYYTTKNSKVTFKYIDADTGEEIAKAEEQTGKVDDLYRTD